MEGLLKGRDPVPGLADVDPDGVGDGERPGGALAVGNDRGEGLVALDLQGDPAVALETESAVNIQANGISLV